MNGGIYNAALFGASQREARSKLDQMAGIKRSPSGILASSPELMQAVAGAAPAMPQRPTGPAPAPMVQPALPQVPMQTTVAPAPVQQPVQQAQAPRPMAPAPMPQQQPVMMQEGGDVTINRQNPKAVRKQIIEGVNITEDPVRFMQTMTAIYGSKERAEAVGDAKIKAVDKAIETNDPGKISDTVIEMADLPVTPESKKDFAQSVLGIDTDDIGEIDDAIFRTLTADVTLSGKELQQAVLLGLQNYKQTAAARAAVKKGSAGKGWLDTEQGKAALTIYTEQIKNNVPPSEAEQMMNEEMGGNIGTMVRMAVTGQTAAAPTGSTSTGGFTKGQTATGPNGEKIQWDGTQWQKM